jgi:hypothetical protein
MKLRLPFLCCICFIMLSSLSRSFDMRENIFYTFKTTKITNEKVKIEVVNKITGKIVYDIILEDVYDQHFHPYEFHNGIFYVIKRTGGSNGYIKHPDNWSDELWKYDSMQTGKLLFSSRGLSFNVSPDEKHIAINIDNKLLFLNQSGKIIRQFSAGDFKYEGFGELYSNNESLFIAKGGEMVFVGEFIKMNFTNYKWKRLLLPKLSFDLESSFNPFNQTIIGSDYPFFIDSYDSDNWKKTNPMVTLYSYDYSSHKLKVIAKSKSKRFYPKWIDENNYEYVNPKTGNKIIHRY